MDFCDPFRGRGIFFPHYPGCRCAQPPANRLNPSGVPFQQVPQRLVYNDERSRWERENEKHLARMKRGGMCGSAAPLNLDSASAIRAILH